MVLCLIVGLSRQLIGYHPQQTEIMNISLREQPLVNEIVSNIDFVWLVYVVDVVAVVVVTLTTVLMMSFAEFTSSKM